MTTLLTVREDLAAVLRPMVGDEVNVYAAPYETVALPAVVIVPNDPWWRPSRLSQSATGGIEVSFDLQILVPRTELETAFTDLETIATAIGMGLATAPVFRFRNLSQPKPTELNEQPALLASIEVEGHV